MTRSEDFWFRWLPAKWLTGTRALSLEARGALADYISLMHELKGPLPDERTAKGMDWHVRSLALRNRRSIERVMAELLELGNLKRLDDGCLTIDHVAAEIVARKARHGAAGRVDNSVGNLGTDDGINHRSDEQRPTIGQPSGNVRPIRRKFFSRFNGARL